MPLEAATKISELNPLWPLGTDPKAEGDNHIRMLKEVLQKTDGGALTGVVVTVLTSSGTWTKPAGLKFLEVTCVGGGGAGTRASATAAGTASASAGGAGGGTAIKLYKAADLAATEAYTVGAAGVGGGAPGTAGGATTFKGMTANGGAGGGAAMTATSAVAVSAGGGGGTAGGGDINMQGGNGGGAIANFAGASSLWNQAGGGGDSFFAKAPAGAVTSGASGVAAGRFPGSGSTGGCASGAVTPTNTLNGGAGCIILKEYF